MELYAEINYDVSALLSFHENSQRLLGKSSIFDLWPLDVKVCLSKGSEKTALHTARLPTPLNATFKSSYQNLLTLEQWPSG